MKFPSSQEAIFLANKCAPTSRRASATRPELAASFLKISRSVVLALMVTHTGCSFAPDIGERPSAPLHPAKPATSSAAPIPSPLARLPSATNPNRGSSATPGRDTETDAIDESMSGDNPWARLARRFEATTSIDDDPQDQEAKEARADVTLQNYDTRCDDETLRAADGPQPERSLVVNVGRRSVKGERGVVVSVNALATRIGTEILAKSGNAVDAAVATAFALAVTHPSAGNLGGGGFALVRLPNGETHALDFRESSPQKLERGRFFAMIREGGEGVDSVGVPGAVAGLHALARRFGRLPFAELVEPARRLAAEGHRVERREATAITQAWPKLKRSSLGLLRYGTKSGEPRGIGATLRLPELASTLTMIRDLGPRGFYEGTVAQSIVNALGPDPQIRASDLHAYRAIWRRPLSFEYRGLRVLTMPPPSAGGVALTASLALLSNFAPSDYPLKSPARTHLLLEVMRRAQADRLYGVVDPDSLNVEERTSRERAWLDRSRWMTRCPISPDRSTDNQLVAANVRSIHESDQTTHLAVVDGTGMAVSLTTTLSSGFGAKVITSSGIILNNSLGSFSGMGENQPAPARRTTSSMAPTLIEDRVGLRLVLGTPGGDSIPSTLLQLVSLLVDQGVPLDTAVDTPRLHQSVLPPGWVRGESTRPISLQLRRALERMGHRFAPPTSTMGHANSIAVTNGIPFGYVDPREGGLALGLDEPSP
jgi:gamma-glutamyltranspeptidase/glutathione hydrolase